MVKEYFAWEGDFKHVGKAFNQGKIFKWERKTQASLKQKALCSPHMKPMDLSNMRALIYKNDSVETSEFCLGGPKLFFCLTWEIKHFQ